jgi:hypothetical protein
MLVATQGRVEGCDRSPRSGTKYRGLMAIVILGSRIGRLGKGRQLSEMRDAPSLSRDGSEDSGQATEHYRPTNNLPLALTSLVGREREMAEANRLLGRRLTGSSVRIAS